MMDKKLVGLPGKFEEDLPHGDVTVPHSESRMEGETKVLWCLQDQLQLKQLVGLDLVGTNWLISAGWLERDPWDLLYHVLWWTPSPRHTALSTMYLQATGLCLPEAKGTGCGPGDCN